RQRALLARRLRRREETRAVVPRPPGTVPPLSHAQERLWFLEQYRPGLTAYTVPAVVRLRCPLDEGALRRALDAVAPATRRCGCASPPPRTASPSW
ncbi:condensation domain-containing protein, partial [Planomonospora algeriensis]